MTAPGTLHLGRVQGYSMSLLSYSEANDILGIELVAESELGGSALTGFGAFPDPVKPYPQFHIGPMGVHVQHGPKLPPL